MKITPDQTKLFDARILDKEWRLSNLYKITNKAGQLITFKPNRAQLYFIRHAHTRNIILKSRQLGFTSLEAIDMLDDVLFSGKNFDALFLSYDQDSQIDIFDNKISLAWQNFPLQNYYEVDVDRANKLKVKVKEGTYASVTVRTSGRSGTYQRVHVSEYGKICKKFPDKADEIKKGTIPAIPIDGRLDIESTAEGENGDFHDMFWAAWNRVSPPNMVEFKAFFFNWTWDDEEIAKVIPQEVPNEFQIMQAKYGLTDQQITYYYFKWLSLGCDWTALKQEYPTTPEEAFIASGSKMFDPELIMQYKTREPIRKVGDWVIYEEPQHGHDYGIGADVSEGVGLDSSTGIVWDFTLRPRVVARYKSNRIAPDMFAYELKWAGELFSNALIAVERNNHGHTTLSKLKEIYDYIYKEERRDEELDITTEKLGWHTNLSTKPRMLYDLRTAIHNFIVEIWDKELLYECRTYDSEDLNVVKGATKHWDLVMAAAIGYQMKSHVSSTIIKTITNTTSNDVHSGI